MRSSKEHAPYSLYKKQTKSGLFWYVRFWDAEAKEYNIVRSTGIQVEGKRERWREADDAAKKIYAEICISAVKPLISEPIAKVANTPLIQYLKKFWTPDSEYAQYKRDVQKKPLTPYYIEASGWKFSIEIKI